MPYMKEAYVLFPYEVFWSGLSPFLETRGYTLRPRYRQGWVPDPNASGARLAELEDAIALPVCTAYHKPSPDLMAIR